MRTTTAFAADWERCAPLLQATLDHAGTGMSAAWVREQVVAGTMQMWPAPDSVIVTQLLDNARYGRTCEITAGGKADTLIAMLPRVEQWARERGCSRVLFWGRVGWQRLLPATARYRVTRHLYEKRI